MHINSVESIKDSVFKNCFPQLEIFSRNLLTLTQIELKEKPFIISLEAPYGAGKTTFIKEILKPDIESGGDHVIYIDAWQYDYFQEPMLCIMDAFNTYDSKNGLESIKKLTLILADIAVFIADCKTLSLAKKYTDALKKTIHNSTKTRTKSMDEQISELKSNLRNITRNNRFYILIDELDRCKPDFALAFLERIKHFFEVAGFCFIINSHSDSFEYIIEKQYGYERKSGMAKAYLERFFDLSTDLPVPSLESYLGYKLIDIEKKDSIKNFLATFPGDIKFKDFLLSAIQDAHGSLYKNFRLINNFIDIVIYFFDLINSNPDTKEATAYMGVVVFSLARSHFNTNDENDSANEEVLSDDQTTYLFYLGNLFNGCKSYDTLVNACEYIYHRCDTRIRKIIIKNVGYLYGMKENSFDRNKDIKKNYINHHQLFNDVIQLVSKRQAEEIVAV